MRKIIVILIPLVLFSCRKDRLTKEKEMLMGTWEWTISYYYQNKCGQFPLIISELNPLTENINYTLKFYKKGIIEIYKDGNLFEKGRIKFDYWDVDNHNLPESYGFDILINKDSGKPISGSVNSTTLKLTKSYFFHVKFDGCSSISSYYSKK